MLQTKGKTKITITDADMAQYACSLFMEIYTNEYIRHSKCQGTRVTCNTRSPSHPHPVRCNEVVPTTTLPAKIKASLVHNMNKRRPPHLSALLMHEHK